MKGMLNICRQNLRRIALLFFGRATARDARRFRIERVQRNAAGLAQAKYFPKQIYVNISLSHAARNALERRKRRASRLVAQGRNDMRAFFRRNFIVARPLNFKIQKGEN